MRVEPDTGCDHTRREVDMWEVVVFDTCTHADGPSAATTNTAVRLQLLYASGTTVQQSSSSKAVELRTDVRQ